MEERRKKERLVGESFFLHVNPRVDNSKQEARETYQFTCTRTHALDIHASLGDPATMPRPNPYRVSQRTLALFFHVGTHYQNGLISFSALSPPSYWNFLPRPSFFLYPSSSKNLPRIRSIDPLLSIIKRKKTFDSSRSDRLSFWKMKRRLLRDNKLSTDRSYINVNMSTPWKERRLNYS